MLPLRWRAARPFHLKLVAELRARGRHKQCYYTKESEQCRSHPPHHLHIYSMGERFADPDSRDVRNHHAQGCPENHRDERIVVGRQCHRGELSLIAHFDQKEGDECSQKHTSASEVPVFIQLVWLQRPRAEGEEREGNNPPQCLGGHEAREPDPHVAREEMIGEGREENAQNDRHPMFELRREQKRQKLGLIAHLCKCDNRG